MICTAPCVPPCTQEATFTLLNTKSRVYLGVNCDHHLAPLIKKVGDSDYSTAPLPAEVTSTVPFQQVQNVSS
jgi:hypothetical protein